MYYSIRIVQSGNVVEGFGGGLRTGETWIGKLDTAAAKERGTISWLEALNKLLPVYQIQSTVGWHKNCCIKYKQQVMEWWTKVLHWWMNGWLLNELRPHMSPYQWSTTSIEGLRNDRVAWGSLSSGCIKYKQWLGLESLLYQIQATGHNVSGRWTKLQSLWAEGRWWREEMTWQH